MKKGFTIIESLIALTIAGMAGTLLISYGTDKVIENKNKLQSKEINDIVSGIDKRLSIDGYRYDLWKNLKNWDETNIQELIKKDLQATNSNCKTGNWNPANNDLNLKLIDCNAFNKNYYNLKINASLNNDLNGFVKSFNIDYSFKTKEDFKKNFKNFRKAYMLAKADRREVYSGKQFFEFINKTNNNNINLMSCAEINTDCIFRISLTRQGGNEYLKTDGSNGMRDTNISFIDTNLDSPLKCIQWKKNTNNKWIKSSNKNCGIGIYKELNHPVMVETLAKNGTFENILLDKECDTFVWNNSKIEYGNEKTPCGLSNDGSNIIQVVDNIQTQNAYIKNIYTSNVNTENVNAGNIVSKNFNSNKGNISDLTSKELIVSNTANIKFLIVEKELTVNKKATFKDGININKNLNMLDGEIRGKKISGTEMSVNSASVSGLSRLGVVTSTSLTTNGINATSISLSGNLTATNSDIKSKNVSASSIVSAPIGNFDNIKTELRELGSDIEDIKLQGGNGRWIEQTIQYCKLHSNKPMPTTSKPRTFTRCNRIGDLRTWNTHEVGSNQPPNCKKNGKQGYIYLAYQSVCM